VRRNNILRQGLMEPALEELHSRISAVRTVPLRTEMPLLNTRNPILWKTYKAIKAV
jgi:hypothetical protein